MGCKGSHYLIGCRSRCGLGGGLRGSTMSSGLWFFGLGMCAPSPPCGATCLGWAGLLGVTILFLLCGGLLFLLYKPHCGTIHWNPVFKVLRCPIPIDGRTQSQFDTITLNSITKAFGTTSS